MSAIHGLVLKMSNWDKDIRYMASSDICHFLQTNEELEEGQSRKIIAAGLKQLSDSDKQVKSQAIKLLALMSNRVEGVQVEEICVKLSQYVIEEGGEEDLRDIYSLALKQFIMSVSDAFGEMVVQRVTDKMMIGISSSNQSIIRESLDIFSLVLQNFGRYLPSAKHKPMLKKISEVSESPN